MKICHNSSRRQCSCPGVTTRVASKNEKIECDTTCRKSDIENYENKILENIGYFVASNDENKSQKYCPTSLQDIDPNELA